MNYWFDTNDALRMSPLGKSVLFHLDKPLNLVTLMQTPRFLALFLVTMSCAGQENDVVDSTGFQPVLICVPDGFAWNIPELKPIDNTCAFYFTRTFQSTDSWETPWTTERIKNAVDLCLQGEFPWIIGWNLWLPQSCVSLQETYRIWRGNTPFVCIGEDDYFL